MKLLITLMIAVGALNMVGNIVRYYRFLRSCEDVLSSGKKSDLLWMNLALLLLVFFLIGYVFVGFFSSPDLMIGLILFFGSIFVTIVETLMVKLMETAKERSINVAEVLVGVIDARDPYLNGHSRHVQELTMLFYRYLPKHLRKVAVKDLDPRQSSHAGLHTFRIINVGRSLGTQDLVNAEPVCYAKNRAKIAWVLYAIQRYDKLLLQGRNVEPPLRNRHNGQDALRRSQETRPFQLRLTHLVHLLDSSKKVTVCVEPILCGCNI